MFAVRSKRSGIKYLAERLLRVLPVLFVIETVITAFSPLAYVSLLSDIFTSRPLSELSAPSAKDGISAAKATDITISKNRRYAKNMKKNGVLPS